MIYTKKQMKTLGINEVVDLREQKAREYLQTKI